LIIAVTMVPVAALRHEIGTIVTAMIKGLTAGAQTSTMT